MIHAALSFFVLDRVSPCDAQFFSRKKKISAGLVLHLQKAGKHFTLTA